MTKLIIRRATVDDVTAVSQLHTRSIQHLTTAEYTPEQIDHWVSLSTLKGHQQRLVKQ